VLFNLSSRGSRRKADELPVVPACTSRRDSPSVSAVVDDRDRRGRVRPFVGIDTIRVRGSVEEPKGLDGFAKVGLRRIDGVLVPSIAILKVEGAPQFRLTLTSRPPQAVFEFSIPKWVWGDNLVTVSTDVAMDAVCCAMARAKPVLSWLDAPANLRLVRVDLVRDFVVGDPFAVTSFIEGQRRLDPPYRPPVQTWDENAEYTNLRRGTGHRWRNSLYDKAAEVASRAHQTRPGPNREGLLALSEAATGVLRNELLLRSPVLREQRLESMSDLTRANTERLHRQYFERAGFHHEVGNFDKVRVAAISATENDRKRLPKIIGMLWMDGLGIPYAMSENTKREYRRTARRLGLTAADVSEASEAAVRLDYDSGELIRTSSLESPTPQLKEQA